MSDQNLEEVTFNITLSSVWWRNPPRVRIWIDDDLVELTTVPELQEKGEKKHIKFSRSLSEGEHTLGIELFAKTLRETLTDETPENNILKDQLLHIEDIEIDEISLGYMIYDKSKFVTNKTLHPDLPDEFTEMVILGYNGKYELKFQIPTYIWFLENL